MLAKTLHTKSKLSQSTLCIHILDLIPSSQGNVRMCDIFMHDRYVGGVITYSSQSLENLKNFTVLIVILLSPVCCFIHWRCPHFLKVPPADNHAYTQAVNIKRKNRNNLERSIILQAPCTAPPIILSLSTGSSFPLSSFNSMCWDEVLNRDQTQSESWFLH